MTVLRKIFVVLLAASVQLVASRAQARTAVAPGTFHTPGAITFCTEIGQPPAAYMAPDGVTPQGFEVDIMRAIGQELGLKPVIVNFDYAAIAAALDAGKCDAVMASTSVTPERLQKYDFVEYMRSSSALLVKKGNPFGLHSYTDLSGRRVAVLLGTVNERRLEDASAQLVAAGKPPIQIKTYKSLIVAFNEFELGRTDAFAAGSLTLAYRLSKSNGEYELGGLPVAAASYGIMVPRGEETKVDTIARAYSALYADGTLMRIVRKWGAEKGVDLCDAKCPAENADARGARPAIIGLSGTPTGPASTKNVRFDLPFFLKFVFHPTHALLAGLGITIGAATVSMLFGTIIGAVLAISGISSHRALRWVNQVYVTFFRGTPVLVQLVLVYFGLPALLGGIDLFPASIPILGMHVSGALVAGIVTFSLHEAAFASEIIRAGIQSIDIGQTEAAQSLGMPPGLTMRRIILPQALRVIIPPLANQCNLMLKTTSLLSVIAIPEMFHVADAIQAATYRTFEVYLGVSIYYLVLTSIVTLGQRRIEQMFRRTRLPRKAGGSVSTPGRIA